MMSNEIKQLIEKLASIQVMFYGRLDVSDIANKAKVSVQDVSGALKDITLPKPYYKWDRSDCIKNKIGGGVELLPVYSSLDDTKNSQVRVRAFRESHQALTLPINASGLAELNFSASGQFTSLEFEEVVAYVGKNFPNIRTLIVVDLRKEAHVFINGVPFSAALNALSDANYWKQPADLSNTDLLLKQEILTEIPKGPIIIQDTHHDHSAIEIWSKKDWPQVQIKENTVHNDVLIQTEEELVESYSTNALKVSYKRFYNLDHCRLSNKNVDSFIDFAAGIDKSNTWLHFHCKGGKGRTTIYSFIYDLLHNAKHIDSAADAFERQVALGGKDFRKVLVQGSDTWNDKVKRYGMCEAYYLQQNYILRKQFLENFFRFSKRLDAQQTWTEWSKANGCGDDSTFPLENVGKCYEENIDLRTTNLR